MTSRVALVAVVLLVTACDQAADPATATPAVAEFSSGALVDRENRRVAAFFFADPQHGWQVIIGNDPRLICSGGNPPQPVDVQHVNLPNSDRVQELIRGDGLQGQVWGFNTFNCGRFLSEDPIAEGTLNVRAWNYFQFLFGERPERWGFRANGAFHADITCTWDPAAASYACNQDRIQLNP